MRYFSFVKEIHPLVWVLIVLFLFVAFASGYEKIVNGKNPFERHRVPVAEKLVKITNPLPESVLGLGVDTEVVAKIGGSGPVKVIAVSPQGDVVIKKMTAPCEFRQKFTPSIRGTGNYAVSADYGAGTKLQVASVGVIVPGESSPSDPKILFDWLVGLGVTGMIVITIIRFGEWALQSKKEKSFGGWF